MKIKPIDIKIRNNWKYGEIAFLVDREDFLKDSEKTRKKLGLKKLIPYKNLDRWLSNQYDQETKDYLIESRKFSRGTVYSLPKGKIDLTIEKFLEKYRKPQTFFLPIRSAILSGIVTDEEYSSTAYCDILYPEIPIQDPKIAIIINPETKLPEIEELFKTRVKKTIEEYSTYILKSKRGFFDTVSNIKRDRRWHWLKNKGLSYSQIQQKAEKEGEPITRDGVIKAIKQYKERLTMEL